MPNTYTGLEINCEHVTTDRLFSFLLPFKCAVQACFSCYSLLGSGCLWLHCLLYHFFKTKFMCITLSSCRSVNGRLVWLCFSGSFSLSFLLSFISLSCFLLSLFSAIFYLFLLPFCLHYILNTEFSVYWTVSSVYLPILSVSLLCLTCSPLFFFYWRIFSSCFKIF